MSGFVSFVEFLVAIGVVIAAISNYLIINKLWKRRDKRDVAESISIAAALLGLFTSIPLFVQLAFIDQTPMPAAKTAIGIATGIVFVMIGSGMWVSEYGDRGFLSLFLRALNLERRECGHLLKEMVRPTGAEQILHILRAMAALDREVHEKETELIEEFAHRWKIDLSELSNGSPPDGGKSVKTGPRPHGAQGGSGRSLLAVRQEVERYLGLEPPPEQAANLLDLLHVFAGADARVSPEEEMVLEELDGLIGGYLGRGSGSSPVCEVLIVPQSEAQFEAVRALLPGTEKSVRGGEVFSVGRFFSVRYAEAVSDRYVSLGLFAAPVSC